MTDIIVPLDDPELAALDAWRMAQDDTPSRADAIRRLLLTSFGKHEVRPEDNPEGAGRAAFETYGPQGDAINPYEPGSAAKARWQLGFGRAKRAKRKD